MEFLLGVRFNKAADYTTRYRESINRKRRVMADGRWWLANRVAMG